MKIPILKKSEYPTWKVKMLMYLEAMDPDYLDMIRDGPYIPTRIIERTETVPKHYVVKAKSEWTPEEKAHVLREAKIKNILHISLDAVMSNRVIACKSAKEIWDTLETQCQGSASVKKNRRALLIQEYEQFDVKPDESLTDLYDRFLTLLNSLSLVDKEYETEDSNTKFLRALPEEWDTQTSIIRHQYDLNTVSLDEVYGMLRTHDLEVQQRKNKKSSKAKTIALNVEAKSKGKAVKVSRRKSSIVESDHDDSSSDTDGNPDANTDVDSSDSDMEEMVAMIVRGFKKMKFRKARRQGNFQKRTFNAVKDKYIKKDSKVSKFDKPKVRCYKCNGMGHFASECKKTKALITSSKDCMDSSSESDTEVVNYALMANTDDIVIPDDKGKRKNVLVMDSGYGNIGQTLGYGNIIIGNVIIEEVALVKGLKHNLLSISQITDRGYHVNFYSSHCEVVSKETGKIALTGYRLGNIYEANILSNTDDSPTCLISKASVDESWNWHKKLSYLNFSNINELVKKDLVRGLPKALYTPDGLCDACQKAKQRRTSFQSKSESSIEEPYHMLHLDLFGPVNIMSISKKRYTLVIVDEYSRFTWVYFLHRKDETPEILLDHVRMIETTTKYKVKILRSDNGTEFKNSKMEEFCKYKGIIQQFSAPGTPQQNGVVERKNKTLIEAGRTMLEEAKLPTYFWAEAVNTACYTHVAQ
ncbi:hypothetical protein POM88_050316 [Heracleum sosnowskyi]|uniref:Uncharacterized protein n=1 Tax=Heracleum sosnowskyi TaxID=360622 RepID=A0AAD8M0A1_9APIA|nr:hypothetical protein POM88_050316 [Heracleum sosnowskyi]